MTTAALADAASILGVTPELLADVAALTTKPDFQVWHEQVERTGGCSRPVRLAGRVTTTDGEIIYDTATAPGGVLLKPCGSRRASVCPSCAYTYAGDFYQLVAAGISGRKNVPETVSEHPMVFATYTAPSFGPVHRTGPNRCRPRAHSKHKTCPHGQFISCMAIHDDQDKRVGTPLCADCYDYEGAVVFNRHAGELWRLTTIATRRALARSAGITEKQFHDTCRLSYVKVAEFQARGAVHFHVVARLDGTEGDFTPPPQAFTARMLADALVQGANHAGLTAPGASGPLRLSWGAQIDARVLHDPAQDHDWNPGKIAAYLAKYSTKSATDSFTLPPRRYLSPELAERLGASRHLTALVEHCWMLADATQDDRYRRDAHMLGYGGHFGSKSRRYSVTLGSLRAARQTHRRQADPNLARLIGDIDNGMVEMVGDWTYIGVGWESSAEAYLAAAAAARARERRQTAHEEKQLLKTS